LILNKLSRKLIGLFKKAKKPTDAGKKKIADSTKTKKNRDDEPRKNRPAAAAPAAAVERDSSSTVRSSRSRRKSGGRFEERPTRPALVKRPHHREEEEEDEIIVPTTPKKIPPKPAELTFVPPEEGKTRFADFPLHQDILFGIQNEGFRYCTPIQAQCLGTTLAGHDLTGKAQTGTGKTAAFLITIFNRFLNQPLPAEKRKPGYCRALILAPTRELAIQIHKDAEKLGIFAGLHNVVVYGGMGHKSQRAMLGKPVDILVGTPGRILDYMASGDLHLEHSEVLVIDEADRMLDMGFIPDVSRIVGRLPNPGVRQTMFFSATLNDNISYLVKRWLKDPVMVETEADHVVADLIDQRFYTVSSEEKFPFLLWVINHETIDRMLIFVNRKDVNSALTARLTKYGVACESLSGDVPQIKRLKILERFRSGELKILIATDVAARGIHVDDVSHVVNYEMPEHPEDYVHRVGRTGRAGKAGKSLSMIDEYGAYALPDIEKMLDHEVHCIYPAENMVHLDPPPDGVIDHEFHPRSFFGVHHGGHRDGGGRRGGERRSSSRGGFGGGRRERRRSSR